jgi:hypothetical protein
MMDALTFSQDYRICKAIEVRKDRKKAERKVSECDA